MTHYFVSSHNGNGKCYDSIDDAREEILLDLVNGIKDAVKRSDMWDVKVIADLMVKTCTLDPYAEDGGHITFDGDHFWNIETCHSYACSDTWKKASW